MVDTAVKEMALGQRPLMTMYVKDQQLDVDNLAQIMGGIRKSSPELADVQMLEVGPRDGRRMIALFRESAVKDVIVKYRGALKVLGVDPLRSVMGNKVLRPVPEILADIAKLPDGLDILKGRDPSDAFMYTWLKSKGMKEEFLQGKLLSDSQGPFRTYPPEVKSGFGKLPPC
jgi:hypothetical protein